MRWSVFQQLHLKRKRPYHPTGGTAGCVVAARVAEADPTLTVLLIERGANNEGKDSVHQPILMPLNLVPDTKTALFYQGKKADAVNGRAITVQAGGVLGGGSSINFMLYDLVDLLNMS